ncbi:MAG: sugar transferase [Butyrivibrio sp.]|nr:sugar transferase [Butyrivibrio sp.]
MNRSNSGASLDIIHIVLDALFQFAAFFLAHWVWGSSIYGLDEWRAFMSVYLICILIFLLINRSSNIYNNTIFFYTDRILRRETFSFVIAAVCGAVLFYFVSDIHLEKGFVLGLFSISYFNIWLDVMLFKNIIDRIVMRKHIPRILYVGSKDSYNKFRYFLAKTSLMVNEIGYISFDDDDDAIEYIGKLSDLENVIRKYNIDQVFILQKRDMDIQFLQTYVDKCIEMGVTCRIVIDTFRRRKAFSYISSIGTYPLYTFHTIIMNTSERVMKRLFDLVFSLFMIILTSPIMLITAIAIKIDSPGPVLFKQVRVGKNGRHFKIWKFRSMHVNAERMRAYLEEKNEVKDGMMFKIKDDPRVTRVGRFIRRTSIDELPQFFNVLAGSMAVVGTRPPTIDEVEKYTAKQWRRISIKPGITGMWQTHGRSSITNFDDVVELDIKYIDEWSIWLDAKILARTVAEVLKRKNSY